MNDTIISELDILRKTCVTEPAGTHKARQYATAIRTLRALPPIHSIADIPTGAGTGIGDKIYKKIQEILDTGHLVAADRARQTEPALQMFQKIYGVGPKKAAEFIAAGYKTLKDLEKCTLTKNMRIGLRHYDDFLARIPRQEMVEHEGVLLCSKLTTMAGMIVGSYRRGAPDSGDIDMLCCPTESGARLSDFVDALKTTGYMTDVLAQGDHKCLAVCRLPGKPYRRLDLLLTPPEEFPFAVLYFTGCDGFNVKMRQRALSLGLTLNEHGLTNLATGKRVQGISTEADIFKALSLAWKTPVERTGPDAVVPI
jgi:hypothetical protein